MKTITIRLNDETEKYLEELSEISGSNQSEVIRDALKKQYLSRKFHELRRRLLPYAEKAGFLTDEDVFKDIS